jgi:hypothetical protein
MIELSDLLIGRTLENILDNMEKERPRRELEIKEMPDEETLIAFLKGVNGEEEVRVVFDIEKGVFVWLELS